MHKILFWEHERFMAGHTGSIETVPFNEVKIKLETIPS